MSIKMLIGFASIGSTIVIVTTIFTAFILFQDINKLRDEVLVEMDEFKILANDAWFSMISIKTSKNNVLNAQREKRQAGDSYVANPTRCPAGPPGQRGQPGLPGNDGAPGGDGKPGDSGSSLAIECPKPKCVSCPAGQPGPQGPDGQAGPSGQPGAPGQSGSPGNVGQFGAPGPVGDPGAPGAPGQPGAPGEPGAPATQGQSLPGPKGAPGPAGTPGGPGQPGLSSVSGPPGPAGPAGQPGQPGQPGGPGEPGQPGNVGVPGNEKGYCPCPSRGAPAPGVSGGTQTQGSYRHRASARH